MNLHDQIENAAVRLPLKDGQGALAGDGVILTSAHCLEIDTTGNMTLDAGRNLVDVETSSRRFRADILFVDPISDVAVLGCPDDQSFSKDAVAYDAFCGMVEPLPICTDDFFRQEDGEDEFPVFVWSHKGEMLEGKGRASLDGHMMWTIDLEIEGGTSGGPIVNAAGELVGIVSQGPEHGDCSLLERPQPIPYRALPLWVLREFFNWPT